MVLKPSDYSLPEMGETMDPTSPVDFLSRFAGLLVVLSVVAFAWRVASGKGANTIDNVAGSLTGGLLSSGDDQGVWGEA